MQYIVKGVTQAMGKVQVIALDPTQAIAAARLMSDQGLRDVVVHDVQGNRETAIAEFLWAHRAEELDRPRPA